MTAAAILARAEAAGVAVEARRGNLRLVAKAPAPTALIHDLAGAKAEVVALLELRAEAAAEHAARLAEGTLPERGTPERERLDREQRDMVAGLLSAAARRYLNQSG